MVTNTTLTHDRRSGCDLSYWEMKRRNNKEYSFIPVALSARPHSGVIA